jgi:hypothetical protein
VNKNAIKIIKSEIGGTPQVIFPESLDPLGILAKNIRYPLPWIFNPCASMILFYIKQNFRIVRGSLILDC